VDGQPKSKKIVSMNTLIKFTYLKHYCFAFLLLATYGANAQMIPFTQNYSAPLMVNPASNGLFNERASIQSNFKSQWGNVAYPYVTGVLNAEVRVLDNAIGAQNVAAIGILGVYDKSNDGGFKQTQIGFNAAFHKSLNREGSLKLGLGVQANFRNYNLDYNKLTFQSQFTPYIGYSSSVPSGEGFGFNSHLTDIGLGLLLSYNETDFSYYLGVAGAHINSPSTLNNSLSFRLPPGLTFHGGFTITDNSDNLIYGSLAHTRSEATNITTLGLVYGRNLPGPVDENGDGDEFQVGAFMRFKDSFAPYVGFKRGTLSIGLNYDITTSELRNARAGAGSMELNLKVRINDNNNPAQRHWKCRFRPLW
jgi:type IX secretion system PorP/SprF family membrane protein